MFFLSRRGFIPKCGDLPTLRRKLVPSHNLLFKGKSPSILFDSILFQSPGFPKQPPHLSLQRCDMSWVTQNVSRPPHHQSGKNAPYATIFFDQKYQCVRKHVFNCNVGSLHLNISPMSVSLSLVGMPRPRSLNPGVPGTGPGPGRHGTPQKLLKLRESPFKS